MTLLHDAVTTKKFDTRVLERNISRGLVRAEDAEKHLRDLPDDAQNADYVSIEDLAQQGDSSS